MPYLPISDGQGNLLSPREAVGVVQCVLLWPERPEYGRELFRRDREGDVRARSELEQSHRQKMPGIATAGEVLFDLICASQYQSGQYASLNRIFYMRQEAPPDWYGNNITITPSASDIKRNWGKYKNVSHLAYAYLHARSVAQPSAAWARKLLLQAEALRDAAENIVLPRSPGGNPILDPLQTWKVPPDLTFSQDELMEALDRMGEAPRREAIKILKRYPEPSSQ